MFILDQDKTFKDLKKRVRKNIRTHPSIAMISDVPIDGRELDGESDFLTKYTVMPKSKLIVIVKSFHKSKFRSKYEEDDSSDDGGAYSNYWSSSGMMGMGMGRGRSRMNHIDEKFKGFPGRSESSKLGEVGLRNLGNTCFMNSALQCLSHTKDLVKYFLEESYKLDKNDDNPIGSKCKLLDAYAELVFQMWNNKNDVVPPIRFKYEMAAFKSMFDGMSQHDSQEFLSELLDGLHEDLNMIQKKPYLEKVEGTLQDNDEEKARESWVNFLKRNFSKIINMFYGQFKSEVKCPACDRTVICFDEYQLISLAVPKKVQKVFECYFISENQNTAPRTFNFRATYISTEIKEINFLKEAVAEAEGGERDDYFVAFAGFSVHGFLVEDESSLQKFIMQTKEKKFIPKAFIFRMDEHQKKIYYSPTSVRCVGLVQQEFNGKKINPGFNQFTFVEPEEKI